MSGLGFDLLAFPLPLIIKGCDTVMIQCDEIIFQLDHGFDQNNWALCQHKIFTGLSINGRQLPILIFVMSRIYSPLYPLIYIGHGELNKSGQIILRHIKRCLRIISPDQSNFLFCETLLISTRKKNLRTQFMKSSMT